MLRRSPRTALASPPAATDWPPSAGLAAWSPPPAPLPPGAAIGTSGHGRGAAGCSAGAHTLAPPGSHVYPDTGNGGYTSVHTAVHLVYDAADNRFLPGNHVVLTDRATQCLTSFSLDFERRSVNTTAGPDMSVRSVTVNGRPAAFRFVQPTYPGDPHGQNDPNPLAHQASELNPVGGPHHNPLPPACSPELTSTSPARQTPRTAPRARPTSWSSRPAAPIRDGSVFTVVGQLHRPARRAQRRRRHHRGLVPLPRRRLRHHRAGRQRGLDAAQRLPGGQAHLRLLRHRRRRADRGRQRHPGVQDNAQARTPSSRTAR